MTFTFIAYALPHSSFALDGFPFTTHYNCIPEIKTIQFEYDTFLTQ